ncbi:hypothetical protein HVX23_18495 [Klebsiella pneumoniae]|uniref:hypothetical protein n=1 Tax=Klebsiella pneumoniae TaxID=573 RepID=UPI0015EA5977|nr:hypothetical protein [Klebsiella pneumoniae]QML97895.1 hypothetical protein HVX23_18495 [Klebsiella pneumoniae]
MSDMQLIDAQCRVEQAQALLSIWLEGTKASERDMQLICALISLLQDVPETIKTAGEELADYVLRAHREKRQ